MVFKRRSKKWEVIEEWRKEEKWEWRGTAAQSGKRVKVRFFFNFISFFFLLLVLYFSFLCIFTLIVFVTLYNIVVLVTKKGVTTSMAFGLLLLESIYGHVTPQIEELELFLYFYYDLL
ncbi:hypothetical protein PITC_075710 [Penicillium italicum]|uniref:Uncharacterized protein n=1 Tax=Penicillium italicum TaxID=40296 RepID=A0A0A2KYY0_PENIT|nr:hypothetical protein PITC_075710 [Penicillium italicum]